VPFQWSETRTLKVDRALGWLISQDSFLSEVPYLVTATFNVRATHR